MSKFFRTFFLCMFIAVTLTVYARAAEDTLKVGLYYGGNALFSANLQNYQGSGYYLGWFDEGSRDFVEIGYLNEEKISMTADGNIYISGGSYYSSRPSYTESQIGGYHVQLDQPFETFEEAEYVAGQFTGGFPAFINNEYRVRLDSFTGRGEAEVAAALYSTYTWEDMWGGEYFVSASVVSPSATGVTVSVTATDTILFEFDCSGAKALGVLPDGGGEDAVTWFRGYKWYGGFEYRRSTGGNINVINVVQIDDYVKGVLPYEMSASWPLEALKAQAVCARTYALLQTKHYASYKFDVCSTTDCQVYQGTNAASAQTDRAAEETAGIAVTYNGEYAETTYYSSNGGASESAENVWTEARGYLVGRLDPYEATITIPSYSYSLHYSFSQLTALLQSKGKQIGTVTEAYVSQTTATGNVAAVTFRDKSGKALTITGDSCRMILGTNSMRFTITGGGGGGYYVNSSGTTVPDLSGMYVISGSGEVSSYGGSGEGTYVLTASGTALLEREESTAVSGDGITITGTGSGHNVGMSQYGAKAMAELGYTYEDILHFYYTDIALKRVG